MISTTEYAISESVARLAGVKLSHRKPRDSWGWDGQTIATGDRNISDVLHDIAHWIVAAPSRRRRREFGLGRGPDSGKPARLMMMARNAQAEEELASLLGIAMEAALGLDFKDTLNMHSWDDYRPEVFWQRIATLEKRGLLKQGRPDLLEARR